MAHSSQASDLRNSAGTSQSAKTVEALAQVRTALYLGGDARAVFDALRATDRATAQAVAHALAAGGVR